MAADLGVRGLPMGEPPRGDERAPDEALDTVPEPRMFLSAHQNKK